MYTHQCDIYPRIILRGTLTTKTALHIGTGLEEQGSESAAQFNQLCLYTTTDAKGIVQRQPYIPASSLRGYLRQIIAAQQPSIIDALFGLQRQKEGAETSGHSSILRVYDCRSNGMTPRQQISRNSIDAITGATRHHHLATHALVPPEHQFNVHIELDSASLQQLAALLKALHTLGADHKGKLGQGKSIGQGELHWQYTSLKLLSTKNLKKWLNQGNTIPHKNKGYKAKPAADKALHCYYSDSAELDGVKTLLQTLNAYPRQQQTLTIELTAHSPILINNPHAVQQAAGSVPDLSYSLVNQQAIIPGSTLKGWVRARCRRILLSLLMADHPDAYTAANAVSDTLIQKIFGSTEQQSYLFFDDAHVTIAADGSEQQIQTFNAIDRFTGGVKQSALYTVQSLWPQQAFSGQIHYQQQALRPWMKLLLLYSVKDSMQGDLVIGWGKSKGYGRLQLTRANNAIDWDSLYRQLNPEDIADWEQHLKQTLQTEMDSLK